MISAVPTMKDVAQKARVSLKTVSRYVNGETNIDPVLAARIGEAISELGYRRNLAAASIRPGWRSRMVGLVISDLANPFYAVLARAIEEELAAQGYLLIVASSEEDGARHDRLVDRLMEQRADGLIIVPPKKPGRDWSKVPRPLPPIVFMDRPGEIPDADVVLADNAGGADQATRALFSGGARRIGFVGDSLDIYTIRERHRGYCDALRSLGLDPEPQPRTFAARTRSDSLMAVSEMLSHDPPDAIFAANNRAVIGAIQAFNRHGGGWLPIIGFDDFESADLIGGGVSVVGQDTDSMGRTAARCLLARVEGDQAASKTITLATRLVLRGSER